VDIRFTDSGDDGGDGKADVDDENAEDGGQR